MMYFSEVPLNLLCLDSQGICSYGHRQSWGLPRVIPRFGDDFCYIISIILSVTVFFCMMLYDLCFWQQTCQSLGPLRCIVCFFFACSNHHTANIMRSKSWNSLIFLFPLWRWYRTSPKSPQSMVSCCILSVHISTFGKAERLLQGGVLPVITQVELLWVGLYPS